MYWSGTDVVPSQYPNQYWQQCLARHEVTIATMASDILAKICSVFGLLYVSTKPTQSILTCKSIMPKRRYHYEKQFEFQMFSFTNML